MTGWPLCLAEIALYSVLCGLVIAMVLDARERWKELRDPQDPARTGGAEEDEAEISGVHRAPGETPDDPEPPPLAS